MKQFNVLIAVTYSQLGASGDLFNVVYRFTNYLLKIYLSRYEYPYLVNVKIVLM